MKALAPKKPKTRECLRFDVEVSEALHRMSFDRRSAKPTIAPFEKQSIVEAALKPYLRRLGYLK